MAHITGGGLLENTHRMFPDDLAARLERARWPRPAIFDWLQRAGNVADAEMHRVFNCGIGMVVVVAAADAERAAALLARSRRDRLPDRHRRAARARRARHRRRLMTSRARSVAATAPPAMAIPRITVLTSGRGSNLAALLDAERAGRLGGTIAAVISNRAGDPRARDRRGARRRGASSSTHRAYRRPRRLRRRARRRDRRERAGSRRARRLHAHPRPGVRRALRGPDAQHPSVAAAVVSRAPHASPRAGRRRAHPRLHRALRDRRRSITGRSSRRARCRCATATTRRRSPRACSRSSTGCCRPPCARSASGRLVIAGSRVRVKGELVPDAALEVPSPARPTRAAGLAAVRMTRDRRPTPSARRRPR